MKQKVSRIIVMALILAMTLTVVGCGKKFDNLDEFVASDEMQTELETVKESLAGSGMSVDIKADGEKLIYAYTLDQQVDPTGMAESLEAAMDQQKDAFIQVAEELKKEVKVDNPVVVVQYLNNDGSEIFSKEYAPE
ncbi:DUF4854 domain-containing protein [Diplocloster agilis]|uniref:DUF4854 domain-containing protein n=1 Tax=Diplocloster agilis TaxID=2850323 RepID=A0A949NCS0_9FIRM|nr:MULTISPECIES: DUF4854 domain-containing protein [Lachnospiraceae]MBU9735166.1 DUF4854 domain-containing protein [Diplocloster agilis]MBU9744161.1 DUF4854 domain-containing protein [Diplocloster agilis]MCU6735488.1 DUF4854 domain-containing protein [Suonthocola fibrivorans]SCJ75069.1 Uncharacterised protein [uncultured Clostridium sp.]